VVLTVCMKVLVRRHLRRHIVGDHLRRRIVALATAVDRPVLYAIYTPVDYHSEARFVAIATSPEEARQKILEYVERMDGESLTSFSSKLIPEDYDGNYNADGEVYFRVLKDSLVKMIQEANVEFTTLGERPKVITDRWPALPSDVAFFEGAND